MRLPIIVAREIVARVLTGEDYRPLIVELIDTEFLNYAIEFFKRIVEAKIEGQTITEDWYREYMLNSQLPKDQIANNAGLNIKTISNIRHTTQKQVVLEEAIKHYERLRAIIDELIQGESSFGVQITLSFRGVSVSLDVVESLIVVNALAVARAAIRGGAWSTAGKQVEVPLMKTLCALHRVPVQHFDETQASGTERETDFFLVGRNGERYRCEVKLLGKGNPESADAAFARGANVFIADTISETMKQQLNDAGILWMELRGAQDWKQFVNILEKLQIPHKPVPEGKETEWLNKCLDTVFTPPPRRSATDVREQPESYATGDELLVDLD